MNTDNTPAFTPMFDAQSGRRRSALRKAIDAATRIPEAQALAPLLARASSDPATAQATDALARQLVLALREGSTSGAQGARANRVQSLMQTFALSSDEGVALMCLAEALLRIPDAATRDALIRDKVGGGDWRAHVDGHSPLFVHAASWGLLITGQLVSTHSEDRLLGALKGLLARSGEPLIRKGVELAMHMLGEQFVTGQDIEEALQRARPLQERGFTYSYDMLGEAALTEDDAQRYLQAYQTAIAAIGQAAQGQGVYAGPGISIKLSALHPRYSRGQHQRVMAELRPRLLSLAEQARRCNIGLNIDAEESERLDLSLDLLHALAHAPSLQGWQGLGFVVQAYGKRCPFVIDCVIDLARQTQRRLMVRLVKGAYWDSEIKRAQQEGQSDYPVFTRKHHTDVSYLACARQLLAARDAVYPQFATHNAHTVAAIVQAGEQICGAFEPGQYEFQCLHGMGEPLYLQVVGAARLRRPCRIYAPVGSHETLLAYLVRRLLENGANSSFVNRMADPGVPLDALVQDPVQRCWEEAGGDARQLGLPHPRIPLPSALYGTARANAQGLDLNDPPTLAQLAEAMQTALHTLPPLQNPSDQTRDVPHAMQRAEKAAPAWAQTPPAQRAAVLERAADLLEAHHAEGMALLVHEAGKTWAHAHTELREAVDFLRFYAAQMRRDFDPRSHVPLGPVLCISPWNFPLAIFLGQVAAALAAGNVVLAKPAEQTPRIADWAVRLLWQAGIAPEALQLLLGSGRGVGMALVQDPRVQAVLFTGSTATAHTLQGALAQRLNAHGQAVPLVAETGGQNAMVVDSSALLEQVCQDAIASAFEAAGQRCSALRVLCVQEEVADRLIALLCGAMAELRVGDPHALHTDVGPVIDAAARERIESHIAHLQALGLRVRRIAHPSSRMEGGCFVVPTLIEIEQLSTLTEEVFGPVLHVLRYRKNDLPQLLAQIRATGYALTLGVHSRIHETIDTVLAQSHAGNSYINRNMVGAVVGVQPFGGDGLSGTGPKAGGPLYLLRLLAQCPPDAAQRSLSALAPTHLPTANPALQALHAWALEQQDAALAQHCAELARHSPVPAGVAFEAELSGPTGERNQYRVQRREQVLCWVGDQASARHDALLQLAAVFAVGSRACVPEQWASWVEALPEAVRAQVDIVQADALFTSGTSQAALIHATAEQALPVLAQISQHKGPIISPTVLTPGCARIPLERLVQERSISTNTAAAGGNASLMAVG